MDPPMMEKLMVHYMGKKHPKLMGLSMLTQMLGQSEETDSNVFEWPFHITGERRYRIDGSPDQASEGGYGKNFSEVRFWMDQNPFGYGDVIRMGDDETLLRVLDSPSRQGDKFLYRTKIVTTNPSEYLPEEYLTGEGANNPTNSAIRIGNYVEEGSKEGGNISYETKGKLRQQLHISRKSHTVTRSAAKQGMRICLVPIDGKQHAYWLSFAELQLIEQHYLERERLYLYGKTYGGLMGNQAAVYGKTGNVLQAGPGIREQVPFTQRYDYSFFDIDVMEGILMGLSRGNSTEGGNTHFAAGTGYLGMKRFHQAVMEKYGDTGLTVSDSVFVDIESGRKLRYGKYFKTYDFVDGNKITLFHIGFYDDLRLNALRDPMEPSYALESGRFTIMDLSMSSSDSKQNLRRVHMKDSQEVQWGVGGSIDGKGTTAKTFSEIRSSSFDGVELNVLTEEAVVALDPNKIAEIRPLVPQ